MKTNLKVALIVLFTMFLVSCSDDDDPVKEPELLDLITPEYLEEQQEILETFGEIKQSLIDGDMDKLISFHAYSPKFTEFINGEPRKGSAANEAFERQVFGAVTEVVRFEADELKVSVYGQVAIVTFHSDFHLKFGGDLAIINEQTSLMFVKTNNGWKIVHEHHSPLNQ